MAAMRFSLPEITEQTALDGTLTDKWLDVVIPVTLPTSEIWAARLVVHYRLFALS